MEWLKFVLFLLLCVGVEFCLVYLDEDHNDNSLKKEKSYEKNVKNKVIWKQTAFGIIFLSAIWGGIFSLSQNSGINLWMTLLFVILLSVELSYALSVALNTEAKKEEIMLHFGVHRWFFNRVISYTGYLRLIFYCFIFAVVDGLMALFLAPCKYQPWLSDLQNVFFILFIVFLGLSLAFLLAFAIQMIFIKSGKEVKELFHKNKKD